MNSSIVNLQSTCKVLKVLSNAKITNELVHRAQLKSILEIRSFNLNLVNHSECTQSIKNLLLPRSDFEIRRVPFYRADILVCDPNSCLDKICRKYVHILWSRAPKKFLNTRNIQNLLSQLQQDQCIYQHFLCWFQVTEQ